MAATYLDPQPVAFINPDWHLKLDKKGIFKTIKFGKPGTAMVNFCQRLSNNDIYSVIAYLYSAFIEKKKSNSIKYHTIINGWEDFDSFAPAFPFVSGEISITPQRALKEKEKMGRDIFIRLCTVCHENGGAVFWNKEEDVNKKDIDAISSATTYAPHDFSPEISDLTDIEKIGKSLYEKNCAFCHAMDGTAKNYIGSFIEPHPRNFTDPGQMKEMSYKRMLKSIKEGIPGTKMSAWKQVMPEKDIKDIMAYIKKVFVEPNVKDSKLLQ